jgi:predicted AlkP superfamily pyrophosphatase or phosphodiesterase
MRPGFPSVTFPNHYALVTGKSPDHNGIVYNKMEDAARPGIQFSMSPSVASDVYWWSQATPLWVTAERQGVKTGTMFWPGSDYPLEGVRPTKWRLFDEDLASFARVDQLLGWLDAPAAGRPRLLTLYFDLVDTAGHRYGPDAPETTSTTSEIDAAIARLVDGLKSRGLAANLVIVADHGMAEVSETRVMDMARLAPPDIARVLWDGTTAGVYPVAGREADAERALLGRKEHGECWRKGEMPARFGYGTNARVPPIVCLADMGWNYRNVPLRADAIPSKGAHGFDPDAPEMAAVFIANGPAFRAGATLSKFPNVSVYPLLAKLAGVTPEANDGSLADASPALIAP